MKKGVTLIELTVCIAIIGVLSAMAVPCIGSMQRSSLDLSTIELLSDIRLCRQKAMDEDSIYHIFFDSVNKDYMIYSYKDMNNCIVKIKKFPNGINFDKSKSSYRNNKISFNAIGKPLPHPCTITLKNSFGQHRSITIAIATDYIGIKNE